MKALPLIFPYLLAQLEQTNNETTEIEAEEDIEEEVLENNETVVEEDQSQEKQQDNLTSIDYLDANLTETDFFSDELDSNATEITTEEPTTTTTSTTTTTIPEDPTVSPAPHTTTIGEVRGRQSVIPDFV